MADQEAVLAELLSAYPDINTAAGEKHWRFCETLTEFDSETKGLKTITLYGLATMAGMKNTQAIYNMRRQGLVKANKIGKHWAVDTEYGRAWYARYRARHLSR